MNIKVDLANFVTIGLTAFLAVWLIDRGLTYAGLGQYAATAKG